MAVDRQQPDIVKQKMVQKMSFMSKLVILS